MTSSSLPAAPPRPHLVVRVGVTGHRAHRLDPAQEPALHARLSEALDAVRTAAEKAHANARWAYAGDAPIMRLISPLADGTDSMAAQIARDEGFALHAPLPFPVDRYRQDFDAETVAAFDEDLACAERVLTLDADEDDAAYLASGRHTLRQSDILIAVWDGQPARGVGGTAMVVAEAQRRGTPIIHIAPDGNGAPVLLLGDSQEPEPLLALDAAMARLFAAPERDDRASAERFFSERERRGNYGALFHVFESLLTWRKPRRLRPRLPRYADTARATDVDTRETLGEIGRASCRERV